MRVEDVLIIVLVAGAILILPVATITMSIIAFARTRKLSDITSRLDHIERRLSELARDQASAQSLVSPETVSQSQPPLPHSHGADSGTGSDTNIVAGSHSVGISQAASVGSQSDETDSALVTAELAPAPPPVAPQSWRPDSERPSDSVTPLPQFTSDAAHDRSTPVGWETFIGQKAFGWVAAVLFLFSATFFLRYSYQNNWIGPAGRVAIGELFGAGLVVFGCRYWLAEWRRFASMLLSTGIVVIYLATYSAFGLYQLLSQQHAGIFLVILVIESMLAAVFCRSALIGLIAVVGGLATPLLMHSDRDLYSSLFLYLLTLNLGVLAASIMQRWRAVASVAFVGTHLIYMAWYAGNYHPEKLAWALGFQLLLFTMYLAYSLIIARYVERSADYEELVRLVVNAVLGFAAIRNLTLEDWSLWIGTIALIFATIYALVARLVLAWRPTDHRLVMTALAISIGFIAWTIPVQADARWIALGWTMMAVALWLFGLRTSSSLLKIMATALAGLALVRLIGFDLAVYVRNPFIPIFNREALPSLAVAGLLLTAVWKADSYLPRLSSIEHWGIGITGLCGITLVWLVLSLDCHGYFVSRSFESGNLDLWRWRAQLALTVFWVIFASALLLLGFYLNRSRLRWFAMALYGLTVLKLFVVDMANVQQIYRIVAFFILAVVLGLVARGYQRFKQ
ncbi:MAG: DUF2339 domain-containing protein [Pirellulaceae bacterium]|nr:DUF2339 domain-containing protein [Pirellulaceae bacterium]